MITKVTVAFVISISLFTGIFIYGCTVIKINSPEKAGIILEAKDK